MHRIIKGLFHAARYPGTPGFAKNSRSRGVKRKGILYEREIERGLPAGWTRGQWITFSDANGTGYAQLDFFHECADGVVVLESKLSWVLEGHSQLELLYRPLVEEIWRKPMIGLLITKRVTPQCTGAIAQTLPSAIQASRNGVRNVVLHWTGKSPLVPQIRPSAKSPLSSLPAL